MYKTEAGSIYYDLIRSLRALKSGGEAGGGIQSREESGTSACMGSKGLEKRGKNCSLPGEALISCLNCFSHRHTHTHKHTVLIIIIKEKCMYKKKTATNTARNVPQMKQVEKKSKGKGKTKAKAKG